MYTTALAGYVIPATGDQTATAVGPLVLQLSHMVTISSIGCEIMPACGVKSCPHVV
jgi:hypothetical protein